MSVLKPLKSLKSLPKKALLGTPPVRVLYAGGAGLNKLTGGSVRTYSSVKAGTTPDRGRTTYSKTTQAASGYLGKAPGAGTWALPVANRATTTGAGQLAATVVKDVAAPVADAAAKGLFGVDLRTTAWIAAGAFGVVVAGPPLIRAATR